MTDANLAKPGKPAGPFSAWEFELALRYLRARRREGGIALIAIISYVAISLAVMALIVVMSIMAGFRSELLSRMLSFNGHMYVQGQVLSDPNRDAMVARLQKTPGVVSVTPVTENQSLVRAAGQTTGAIVRGISARDLGSMAYVAESLTPESRRSFGQGPYGGDNILIGEALAQGMGLQIGDSITLYSPTGADSAFGNLGGLEKTYRVGGMFTSGAADFDRAYIFMPLEQAQLFFGKEGVWDVVEMKVREPDRVGDLVSAVRQAAGPG
ncbi:MAG TPA: ABC transporter permease, partial [Brevundimonas sp.]|nr:ABC transporter permease [Brevundimonas sp.]